jgi:hypothetical protein
MPSELTSLLAVELWGNPLPIHALDDDLGTPGAVAVLASLAEASSGVPGAGTLVRELATTTSTCSIGTTA